jgi:hypothetical protein
MHCKHNGAPFCSPVVSMEPMNTSPLGQTSITFINGCCAMLLQLLNQMVLSYLWIQLYIFLVTYLDTQPWIALTNLCAIHGIMGVYNRFEIQRLFSQLLKMLSVAQHLRGCLFH